MFDAFKRGDGCFCGDLFHAGAGYETENRRLYFKAIPKWATLYPSERGNVAYGYVCQKSEGGCGEKFRFESQLKDHKDTCEQWRITVEEKKLARKRKAA